VQKVIAQACPPAAKLCVAFEGLGGYEWRVEPSSSGAASRTIAQALRHAIAVTLSASDPLDAVELLDRLYTNSPVGFELQRNQAADASVLIADISELLARFARSRSEPELLLIQASDLSMSLTLKSPSLTPRGTTECPACGGSTKIVREVYPGADGCTGCGAIFVGQCR
jgi:hypothetical protein